MACALHVLESFIAAVSELPCQRFVVAGALLGQDHGRHHVNADIASRGINKPPQDTCLFDTSNGVRNADS